jgi:hypothetical protein
MLGRTRCNYPKATALLDACKTGRNKDTIIPGQDLDPHHPTSQLPEVNI